MFFEMILNYTLPLESEQEKYDKARHTNSKVHHYLESKLQEISKDLFSCFCLFYKLHNNPIKIRQGCLDYCSAPCTRGECVDETPQPTAKAQGA